MISPVRTRFTHAKAASVMTLPANHEAVRLGTPLFTSRVRSARDVRFALIEGDNNSKLGSHFVKGWPGARIFSLSLPERSTCPRSCPVWRSCYGNRQQYTIRLAPDEYLMPKLATEVADLTARGNPVAVRLHQLGDFYSVGYTRFWIDLVRRYSNLHVFGFTGRKRGSAIGRLIERESAQWERFKVRFSDGTGERSAVVEDDPLPGTHGGATTCPVEKPTPESVAKGKAVKACGECALCLTSKLPIVFELH